MPSPSESMAGGSHGPGGKTMCVTRPPGFCSRRAWMSSVGAGCGPGDGGTQVHGSWRKPGKKLLDPGTGPVSGIESPSLSTRNPPGVVWTPRPGSVCCQCPPDTVDRGVVIPTSITRVAESLWRVKTTFGVTGRTAENVPPSAQSWESVIEPVCCGKIDDSATSTSHSSGLVPPKYVTVIGPQGTPVRSRARISIGMVSVGPQVSGKVACAWRSTIVSTGLMTPGGAVESGCPVSAIGVVYGSDPGSKKFGGMPPGIT